MHFHSAKVSIMYENTLFISPTIILQSCYNAFLIMDFNMLREEKRERWRY